MLRYIILAPLLGFIVNALVLRSSKNIIAGVIATAASLAAFVFSLVSVGASGGEIIRDEWFTWFQVGRINVPFHLELTPMTGIMLLVITGIGTLIHLYSIGYMSHEKNGWRFFSYLNLFLVAMLILVLSSNLVGVFLGWEGVGLCSYLLIGYWFEKDANAAAGMKAFVTNRIGDLGFLLALFVLITQAGTIEIREVLQKAIAGEIPAWAMLCVAGALFWASTGKSAQIPLFVWLPDAMAGPTPVSALIHAATMVTSGLFVCTRMWPLFASVPEILPIIMWVGIATAWLAALVAITQRDIKKVLAYSTVSQLGFMFAAVGAGAPIAGFFHVVTHACFKALLFLGAGSVIHGVHEKQDLFDMGNLKTKMPITHITFLIANLAIIGFPLTAGFFSKDLILVKAFETNKFAWFALLGAALLTAFYMFRLYALAFHGKARTPEANHAHESHWTMTAPLVVLAILSLFVGFVEIPHIWGHVQLMSQWVEKSWYGLSVPVLEHAAPSALVEWMLILITSAFSIGIAWLAFKKYSADKGAVDTQGVFADFSRAKFYVDETYNTLFVAPLRYLAGKLTKIIDTYVINGTLHVLRDGTKISGQVLSLFHTGSLQTYAWYFALGTATALVILWTVMA